MLGAHLTLPQYLDACQQLLRKLDQNQVQSLADELYRAHCEDRAVFLCGNGGSSAIASQVCHALSHGTIDSEADANERRLRAISLSDNTPGLLAWADDFGLDCIFAEQLKTFATPGDILIAISGTGRSPNVLQAVAWANDNALKTWAVTGCDGGELRKMAHETLRVPIYDAGLVDSIQLLLLEWIAEDLSARISQFGRYESEQPRNGAKLKLWPGHPLASPPQDPRPA